MADAVVISNLALARLGDEATVSGIEPPEGSDQAEHCALFFPIARRSLLEMYPWDFATQSLDLEQKSTTVRGWAYSYAKPANCIKVHAVLPPGAGDDYSLSGASRGVIQSADGTITTPYASGYNLYTPQPFKLETNYATKAQIILTNQAQAQAICTFDVEDTDAFSPLFDDTLAWLLASYIAGPIYKGKSGVEMSQFMLKSFLSFYGMATTSNASQEFNDVQVSTPWIAGR